MPVKRDLICLANSRKGNGFCFAGIDPETLEWVRPTGAGWDGAVLAAEQGFADGGTPALLDLVTVKLARPAPEPGQPENWQLAPGLWRRKDRISHESAVQLLSELATDEPLFGNRGKAVTPEAMAQLDASLAIARPTDVTWEKRPDGKLRALFDHAGRDLDLSVSDPAWRREFADDAPGRYDWPDSGETFLTLSVTVHAFHEFHWKIVAGVVHLDV